MPDKFSIESDLEVEAAESLLPPGQDVAVVQAPGKVVAVSESDALLNAIVGMVNNPAVRENIDVFDRLIAMRERMEDRGALKAFNAAFVRLQGKLPVVKRNGALEYPTDKNKPDGPKKLVSRYALWEDIHKAIRPVLEEEGFALSFEISPRQTEGGGLLVAAVLRHAEGHSVTNPPMPVALDTSGGKNNVQAYGSALSYGKRYAAFAALNINTEGDDDDGKKAGMRYLSETEIAQIAALIDETNTDPQKFFAAMISEPVKTYSEIDSVHFDRLKNSLLNKKRQMTKGVEK